MQRLNGAYFDPAAVGCGFFITDEGEGKVLVGYFGHDRANCQIHLTGFGRPEEGFELTMTRGAGFPTHTVENHEKAGFLQFSETDAGLIANLSIAHELLGGVDVSPLPPPGYRVLAVFKLSKIGIT